MASPAQDSALGTQGLCLHLVPFWGTLSARSSWMAMADAEGLNGALALSLKLFE